jgi:hypothetical protein
MSPRLRRALAAAVAVLAVACAGRAAAAPGLLVGVDDDAPKWGGGLADAAVARDLGLKAFRITLAWAPGESRLTARDRALLDRAVGSTLGLRLVVAVYGGAAQAPRDAASRTAYCSYVGDLLRSFPTVNDVVIWNEPNSGHFWRPQYNPDRTSAAPVAYEALLAACWDTLHAVRRGVNVIAASASLGNDFPEGRAVSHSPAIWYRELGIAYRLSGRRLPILDTIGHNPYPSSNAEAPSTAHGAGSVAIGEGDYRRLVAALQTAFAGTDQPLPGRRGVSIWYLEQGFQTTIDPAKASLYSGRETEPNLVPPLATAGVRDQATQLADALRVAYCQPYVGAFFNFELADESILSGWQSGLLWADGSPKPSYSAVRQAIADVEAGRVSC